MPLVRSPLVGFANRAAVKIFCASLRPFSALHTVGRLGPWSGSGAVLPARVLRGCASGFLQEAERGGCRSLGDLGGG